jgi:hypothetical protein
MWIRCNCKKEEIPSWRYVGRLRRFKTYLNTVLWCVHSLVLVPLEINAGSSKSRQPPSRRLGSDKHSIFCHQNTPECFLHQNYCVWTALISVGELESAAQNAWDNVSPVLGPCCKSITVHQFVQYIYWTNQHIKNMKLNALEVIRSWHCCNG